MGYFYKNKFHDVYSIDKLIYAKDGDIIMDEYIEIFNNEELVLDFSNTVLVCSNEKIKGAELHKIKIDWGDGKTDVLVKNLLDSGSSISNIVESWKIARHIYNTDKRHIYLAEKIESLPKITVYFYNTYNDIVKLVLPYKLVYKSFYDLNCTFDVISANTGNNNLTTFVMKESANDSISIVQSINNTLNFEDKFVYITDKTASVDYSDEYIDEDNVLWGWDQIPYVYINVSYNQYLVPGNSTSLRGFRCVGTEKTVPVEEWTPHVNKITDDGNKTVSNVIIDDNQSFMFYVFGGSKDNYVDLETGLYEIYLDVTGINDVKGCTDKKIVANPTDSDYTKTISYSGNTTDSINYKFTLSKGNSQWSYFKNVELILKPTKIDKSENGLGLENTWVTADEYFNFSFPLDLSKKNGTISIPMKSLPNGNYDVYYKAEDLLGNNLNQSQKVANFAWKYTNIGEIYGNWSSSGDESIFSWNVSSPTEMDKIQFKLIKNGEQLFDENNNPILDVNGDIVFDDDIIVLNEKKPYNKWDGWYIENNVYNFFHKISHKDYEDGDYTATVSHILDMNEMVGERKKAISKDLTISYNRPNITIKKATPIFKLNKAQRKWESYIDFNISSSKPDVTEITLMFDHYKDNSKTTMGNEEVINETKFIKPSSYFFLNYDEPIQQKVDISFKCRDIKDSYYKRFGDSNVVSITRNTNEFLKCHTELPENVEIIDPYGKYYDENNNEIIGIDIINESAMDVYRTHSKGNYFKYEESNKKPHYFDKGSEKIYSYFTTKTYTDENGIKFKRFVNSDITSDNGSGWTKLSSVESKFSGNNFEITEGYDQSDDSGILTFTASNASVSENIMNSRLILIKDNVTVYENHAKDIKTGHKVTNLDLGRYKMELDYSALDTNNVDSTKIIKEFDVLADKNSVIGNINITKNEVESVDEQGESSSLYTVTVSWELYHKKATNLTAHVRKVGTTNEMKLENALSYNSYTPGHYFSQGDKIEIWFTMSSKYVKFDGNLTSGQVGNKESITI